MHSKSMLVNKTRKYLPCNINIFGLYDLYRETKTMLHNRSISLKRYSTPEKLDFGKAFDDFTFLYLQEY